MNQLFAIIILTYRESIRKRIFLIIAVFTVLLIILSAFSPVVKPIDRIRLTEAWTLQGIGFFVMLIAVFMAATSLPEDIELKRLFLLLAKPVTKEMLLLGKLLGFVLTTGLFILIMGAISLVYLYIVNWSSGHLTIRDKILPTEMRFTNKTGQDAQGYVTGNYISDKEFTVMIEGEGNNYIGWLFRLRLAEARLWRTQSAAERRRASSNINLNKSKLSEPARPTEGSFGQARAELSLMIGEGQFKVSSEALVRFVNPTTKQEYHKQITLSYKRPEAVEFPAELIDRNGELYVYVSRPEPATYIRAGPASVVLKSLGVIWLQVILLLGFCISGATFLSGGVNVVLNIFIYFVGSGTQFWASSLETMRQAMTSIIRQETLQTITQAPAHSHSPEVYPLWMMKASEFVVDSTLKVFPDFSRFNSGDTYLLNGYAVPWNVFPPLVGYVIFYGIIAFVVGAVAFRLRDIK
ncbi:MAG: hypothetical protein HY762_08205 [Planctomycetes bacterium]|nr:hypothetical protein [Planctomycetota bacterium]